jgi:class 3 adenylate cyclase
MAENRKLAAIMAADVVGFSRLTGADEDRTLARLRALRSDRAALAHGAADAAAARCRIAKHSASRST